MKRCLIFHFGLHVLFLIMLGCSDKPKDDWYEESQQHTADRETYVREQVLEGIPEEEARATADLNWYIENTIRPKDQEGPPPDVPPR